MRVLGIDYGSKRVGVALGDTETRIASAWEVLPNEGTETLVVRIADILKREGAESLVVGIPRPLQDSALNNGQVQEIRKFISALREHGLDVFEWDEALTSKMAARQEFDGRSLTAAGRVTSKGGKRDDMAAAAILDGWLNRVV